MAMAEAQVVLSLRYIYIFKERIFYCSTVCTVPYRTQNQFFILVSTHKNGKRNMARTAHKRQLWNSHSFVCYTTE